MPGCEEGFNRVLKRVVVPAIQECARKNPERRTGQHPIKSAAAAEDGGTRIRCWCVRCPGTRCVQECHIDTLHSPISFLRAVCQAQNGLASAATWIQHDQKRSPVRRSAPHCVDGHYNMDRRLIGSRIVKRGDSFTERVEGNLNAGCEV